MPVFRSWCPDLFSARLDRVTESGPAGPGEEQTMPLFMDVHTLDGTVGIDDVAQAHQADLKVQGAHAVDYQRYWVDEAHGKIFCLVEAPDATAAADVHREAHGLVAGEIYPVAEGR
jgi:hypothetical protein